MSSVQSTQMTKASTRHWWYFIANGFIAGAAVVAFGLVPQAIAVVPVAIAVVAILVVDRVARRSSRLPFTPPVRGGAIGYLIVLGVVVVGAIVLLLTVGRNDGNGWLPWLLGVVVLVAIVAGAWVPERRPAQEVPAA